MRKLLSLLARPIVWSTGGLLLLLLALHVVSPLLGLEEDKRWVIELLVGVPLAAFLLAYWLRQLLIDRRLAGEMAVQAKNQAVHQGPDALRDFKAFSAEFTRAFQQLNQTCRERGQSGGAAELPWVMILGPSGVGKSTALERSGLRFTSLGRRLQGIGGTRNCTWWLASDAVFLDTAGRYAVQQEDRDEWRAFLHLLRRRRRRPIDAVLLQVGIDELLERPRAEVERAALQLRERLDELVSLLGVQVPVHLLFNKCDLLDGFAESFAGLDDAERVLPWGFELNTAKLAGEPISDLFNQRFSALVRALGERLTTRLMALPEREPREAALSFPAELAAAGATLGLFTETLLEPRAHGERPWLCAVYLASAEATGQRLAGLRQRRAEELGLAGGGRYRTVTPPLPGAATVGETFFLRGVFAQVLRQAEHSARPSAARQRQMVLQQRLAVAVGLIACIAGSWYLGGRYSAGVHWLRMVAETSRQLHESPGVSRAADHASKEELVTEIEHQDALRELLDNMPTGLPTGPHQLASRLLRRRVEEQWLRPLQGQMKHDLEQAANRQSNDPGEDFARGFAMLRLSYVLHGNVCQGTDADDTRHSLSLYLIEHWQRALGDKGRWLTQTSAVEDEDPSHPRLASTKLRRSLEFFLQQEPEQLRETRPLHDEALREQARLALASGGDQSAVVFNLRASLANLYERSNQLSSPMLVDSGIERVFTDRGCSLFFGREAQRGSEWWTCVLNMPLPKAPANLDELYRQKYTEAWNRWLHELALRSPGGAKEPAAADLGAAIAVFDGLLRDAHPGLTQIIQTVGLGRADQPGGGFAMRRKRPWYAGCGRQFGRSVDWGSGVIKDFKVPPECKGALSLVTPFGLLSGREKPAEDDADATVLREDYQKYLAAAKTLRTTLYRIKNSTDRYAEALKLVQATMGATGDLWAVNMARIEFLHSLQNRLLANGIVVSESGLQRVLLDSEERAWHALLPLAARALNEQWRNQIWTPWQTLNGNHHRQQTLDEEFCKVRTEFMRKELGDFANKSLAVFYVSNNLASGKLKDMAAPFAERLPLVTAACDQINRTHKVGEEITDCPKAVGPAGSAPKHDPLTVDMAAPTTPGCTVLPLEVLLDRSDKVFSCPLHTGKCSESPEKTSQRARLRVKWQNRSNFDTIYDVEDREELYRHAETHGNRLAFRLPKNLTPGRCEGYTVWFTIAAGGGGPAPKVADQRWKQSELPATLVQGP